MIDKSVQIKREAEAILAMSPEALEMAVAQGMDTVAIHNILIKRALLNESKVDSIGKIVRAKE